MGFTVGDRITPKETYNLPTGIIIAIVVTDSFFLDGCYVWLTSEGECMLNSVCLMEDYYEKV